MIRLAKEVCGAAVGIVLAVVAAECNQGCAGVQTQAVVDRKYEEALLACVSDAGTREDSKACRAKVNREYNVCEGQWPRLVPCQ